jgi:hypothetical protein
MLVKPIPLKFFSSPPRMIPWPDKDFLNLRSSAQISG